MYIRSGWTWVVSNAKLAKLVRAATAIIQIYTMSQHKTFLFESDVLTN